MLIARVIAEPAGLSPQVDDLLEALGDDGFSADAREIPGGVVEIAAEGASVDVLRAAIDKHLGTSDALITDQRPVLPRLFISDMDSTMISAECIDELADFAGLKPQIAAITERAMQGELDFREALTERVALLKDLSEDAIAQCLAERIKPMKGARVLVQTLKAKGCRTVLVTGGFHQFADPVAEQLGFERVVGNRLAVAGGKLTGGLDGPISDSATKRATLLEEQEKLGGKVPTLATGDGANDIPMIEEASYGIAFEAKPKARAAANGWVDRGDLTAVLRLLGVPEKDWVLD
ncbi:phosphoserine phosphatase SerB [Novosphingobium terrae]|uniref:phosphoserine phosphatase SerB n=1 Tax=Novosphingobium terrae TaxID=2726189 RepID=UPI001F12E076|nr:phosphoserine phosphatase SerB [Novosphingobium terrae]